MRETLFTVGNGRLGTRGTLEEGHVGELSGTYLSGVYDGHQVPVIDLVNAPDWLSLARVRRRRTPGRASRCACSTTSARSTSGTACCGGGPCSSDADGRRTRLESLRFASLADRRLCALRVEITPLDHDAEVTVESALVGRRRNLERLPVYPAGTSSRRRCAGRSGRVAKHLVEVEQGRAGGRHLPGDAHHRQRHQPRLRRGAPVLRRSRSAAAVQRSYERIEEHAARSRWAAARRAAGQAGQHRHVSRREVEDVQAALPRDLEQPSGSGLRREPRSAAARCGSSAGTTATSDRRRPGRHPGHALRDLPPADRRERRRPDRQHRREVADR